MPLTLTPLASDNFTRANENPLSQGGNWSVDTHGDKPLQLLNDLCEGTATLTGNVGLYVGYSLPNDQYVSVTENHTDSTGDFYVGCRVTDTGVIYFNLPGYLFAIIPGTGWNVKYENGSSLLSGSSLIINSGDVFTIAVVGTAIYVFQNSTQLGTVTNSSASSGEALLACVPGSLTDVNFSNFVIGSAAITTTWSISGNAGVAGATVSYSGTAMGSVTADGSGNYSITGLSNGSYTITPSLAGYTFSPTSSNQTVSSANITGVNFTATAAPAYWSQPDCRQAVQGFGPGPNTAVTATGGTLLYTGQTSSNGAVPPTDSRKAGAPVASGTYPQNNRNNPTGI